jgi:hypothetical protein
VSNGRNGGHERERRKGDGKANFGKNILAPFSVVAAALLMGWANYSVLQVKNQIDQRHQEVQETLNQREIALNMLVAELHVRNSDEDEQNFW